MKKAFLLFLFLLFPLAVSAADGDPCSALRVDPVPADSTQGPWNQVFCKTFLDAKLAATGSVAFDLWSIGTIPGLPKNSLPDKVVVETVLNDCTAGNIVHTNSETLGGYIHPFSAAATLTLTAAGTGTNAVYLTPPFGHFVNATWDSVAGCTNGFTTYILGYVQK